MSGPVTTVDDPGVPVAGEPRPATVELLAARPARVGGMDVQRLLPQRARRLVGPWCFADHLRPAPGGTAAGLDIGPHPHMGLQTVTWLLAGGVLHRDSLGSEQLVRPGQLNLMTAGHGVSHAEEAVELRHRTATTGARGGGGPGTAVSEIAESPGVHGIQLWIAQPSTTREGPASFEHHAELPSLDVGAARVTVLVGAVADARSPARRDTEHVGAELDLRRGRSVVPLEAGFEHALAVLEGRVRAGTSVLLPGTLAYLGQGRDELALDAEGPARALLVGGAPFPEPVLMWWNYVGRAREELAAAHRSWTEDDGRFGSVRSPLARLGAPPPPWVGDVGDVGDAPPR